MPRDAAKPYKAFSIRSTAPRSIAGNPPNRQLDGVRCLARLRFGGRMPSMAAVARSLQEVFDDVEIVHLLTDAKAERTVVMTWRDTWRNESYELG